jgi:hypothetical protein
MPIVGPVVKGAKTVATAVYDEMKRADASAGEARIQHYITSTRNAVSEKGGLQTSLLQVMEAARPLLLAQYRAAVAASASGAPAQAGGQAPTMAQGAQGTLTGEAATFMRDLKKEVASFISRVPTAATFQRRFTEAFADTPGRTGLVSQGGLESGSLHLHMHVVRKQDSGGWSLSIDDVDPSWNLATTAPRAERLAQSLKDTMGTSVAGTKLPKYLHVLVETDIEWALNDYKDAIIYFEDPASPEYRGHDPRLSQWAWEQQRIRQRALGVAAIRSG